MSAADANTNEPDFEALMKQLAAEAQRSSERADVRRSSGASELVEMLRPVSEGIQALSRAVMANTNMLMMHAEQQKELPNLLTALHTNLDDRKAVSKKLFDALHEELRGYKDAFLFEALQKPMVRDLIVLYDDLSTVHHQFCSLVQQRRPHAEGQPFANELLAEFDRMLTSVDHATHVLLEILRRLEVERMEAHTGKLDKQRQRVTMVAPAASMDQDNDIVHSLKPGFTWRGRIVRPEEVVVRKFRPDDNSPEDTCEGPNDPFSESIA